MAHVINTKNLKTMAFRKMALHSGGQCNKFRLLKLYGICENGGVFTGEKVWLKNSLSQEEGG